MRTIRTEYYKMYHKSFEGRISFFSDLHFSYNLPDNEMNQILDYEYAINPDYIVITGDLVDSLDVLVDDNEKYCFLSFLKNLSMIAPLYVSFGNHDFYGNGSYSFRNYKKDLVLYSNVGVLDNKKITTSNFNIAGISMTEKDCASKAAFKRRLLAYNDVLKTYSDKLNILLTHSPKFILDGDIYDLISSFDYVFSGHLHNGSIPGYMNFIPGTIGLIGPYKDIFPINSRNTYKKEGDKLIVTGAVRTFHTMSGFEFLNSLYPIQNVVLDFDSDKKVYKKVFYER